MSRGEYIHSASLRFSSNVSIFKASTNSNSSAPLPLLHPGCQLCGLEVGTVTHQAFPHSQIFADLEPARGRTSSCCPVFFFVIIKKPVPVSVWAPFPGARRSTDIFINDALSIRSVSVSISLELWVPRGAHCGHVIASPGNWICTSSHVCTFYCRGWLDDWIVRQYITPAPASPMAITFGHLAKKKIGWIQMSDWIHASPRQVLEQK